MAHQDAQRQRQPASINTPDVVRILQPIFDLSVITKWNAPSQVQLANLIVPHTALDLTVRELLEYMIEVRA